MSYSVMLYCNRNTVIPYSVTSYRNQISIVSYFSSDVSYPVAIDRNLYAVVSASYPDVSLSMKMCAQRKRREGNNGLRLPSVPFPWSLAVHDQSEAFGAHLYHAKNEGPEEEAAVVSYPVKLHRRVNDVVSYPVTTDGIQKIVISYNMTVYYNRDAVMSVPFYH